MLIFVTSFVAEKINMRNENQPTWPIFFAAAFLAISFRRLADMPSVRAFPPLRPSVTAAGSCPSIRWRLFADLAGGNPHDMDRVDDHIGGTFFAFRASWHRATT